MNLRGFSGRGSALTQECACAGGGRGPGRGGGAHTAHGGAKSPGLSVLPPLLAHEVGDICQPHSDARLAAAPGCRPCRPQAQTGHGTRSPSKHRALWSAPPYPRRGEPAKGHRAWCSRSEATRADAGPSPCAPSSSRLLPAQQLRSCWRETTQRRRTAAQGAAPAPRLAPSLGVLLPPWSWAPPRVPPKGVALWPLPPDTCGPLSSPLLPAAHRAGPEGDTPLTNYHPG